MTTGTLQQLVYLKGEAGRRARARGRRRARELLRAPHARPRRARAVGMTTELPRHQSLALPRRHRAPLAHAAVDAHGRHRDPWPAARGGGGADRPRQRHDPVGRVRHGRLHRRLDPRPRAGRDGRARDGSRHARPRVDAALRTSRAGVFAAGNLLHGAETADVAALSGRHAAAGAAATVRGGGLAGGDRPDRVRASPPLDQPQRGRAPRRARPPRHRLLLRSQEFVRRAHVEIVQDGRRLWAGRLPKLVPGRSAGLPHSWAEGG